MGFTAADQLVLPLTIAFVLAALASGAVRMLLLWASTRFTFAAGADLSIEVYRRTLLSALQRARRPQQQRGHQRHHQQGRRHHAGRLLPCVTLLSAQ